jgi:hypothetical protein
LSSLLSIFASRAAARAVRARATLFALFL